MRGVSTVWWILPGRRRAIASGLIARGVAGVVRRRILSAIWLLPAVRRLVTVRLLPTVGWLVTVGLLSAVGWLVTVGLLSAVRLSAGGVRAPLRILAGWRTVTR
jgi:hypothetical protein